MKRICTLLITVTLLAGMVGCSGNGESYTLTITSTPGGSVVEPGEGTFTYDAGTEVDLMAEADEGYQFVNWSGGLLHIADYRAAATTIVMDNDYSISANFAVPTLVWDWYDLNAIRDDLRGIYILMNDLNSTTPGYEELAGTTANGGKGWQSIGSTNESSYEVFVGTLDGGGYEICDLFINRPDEYNVGLFNSVYYNGGITNLGVVNATVTGYEWVGGLVALSAGTVSNSYSTGSVNGTGYYVGGLVGVNGDHGTVSNSYSIGNVTGNRSVGGLVGGNAGIVSNCHFTGSVISEEDRVGGLVGWNQGTVSDSYATGSVSVTGTTAGGLVGENYDGTVSNSYSTGSVAGEAKIGGLVGINWGTVSNSYSMGSVSGNIFIGGLVGANYEGTVTNCYATGSVTGVEVIGGLVGSSGNFNNSNVSVSHSYATGSVTGNESAGGLVGRILSGTVSNSYSIGSVIGNNYVGGLVGDNSGGTVSNSFWDTETSGQATSDGGTGKNTAQMQNIATFSGATWDIIAVANPTTRNPSYIWNIIDDETYPFLSWQPIS